MSVIASPDVSKARRGAALLLEILASEGVEYIFGNPGTTELPLMDALLEMPSIHYVLALQEASAVAMADGYAQAAGKPGFLNLHTAGGLGHGMGALLNAATSQTPLVVTAGQQDSRHTVTDPLLYGDLVSIARPAVKWAQEVTHVDQLPVLVRRAFHDAEAAPSGPVFLSFPMDVMEARSTAGIGAASTVDFRPVAGSLDALAAKLAAVAPGRLAIIAGDEVYDSGATAETVALAEALGAPVYGSSWPFRMPFPTAHPHWSGNLPNQAAAIARILGEFDAVFGLGGKSLITLLYTEVAAVPSGCAVFQLSDNVRDLGRTYPTQLSVTGDIRASLTALMPLLQPMLAPHADAIGAQRQALAEAHEKRRAQLEAEAKAQWDEPVIAPMVAAQQAVRAIGPDVAIIDEAIATSAHVRSFLETHGPRQYSFIRGGVLGWGMPAAVGCSLGLGRAPVVCLVGDGAALYSPQSLWTAANEKLPVTFVVMNNREYNVLKNFMKGQTDYVSSREGRFLAMDIVDPPIDYQSLARSMGVASVCISKAAEIAPAIEAGIRSGRPNLVEIIISAK